MLLTKAQAGSSLRFATVLSVVIAALTFATVCALVSAQEHQSIKIIMLDGKTGEPIKPANYVIRFDNHDVARIDVLHLDDEGVGTVLLPADSSMISVQGTYHASMEVYINCDAAMQKDTSTRHWYPIAEILKSGINSPNECYKGKYAEATRLNPKPGTFVFYVRPLGWRESSSD
jgi:hypothetical protein